jgi:hypothetical protein
VGKGRELGGEVGRGWVEVGLLSQELGLHSEELVRTSTLIFIIGPPAVGKMAVGYELAQRSGFKLFHNHQTIELVLRFFPFGSPAFSRLVREFRRRIFEEVAESDLPGLIFTYVWAFDEPSDAATVKEFANIFTSREARVLFVELEATLEERLRRNQTEFRLAEKPSKRDLEASQQRLLHNSTTYKLNSTDEFRGREDYLRIDNTDLSAGDAADIIIRHFGLVATPATEESAGVAEHQGGSSSAQPSA